MKHTRKARNELLKHVLTQEVERLSALSTHDLRQQIPEPLCHEVVADGLTCQVEIQILEDESDYLHVAVAVDDGSLLRSFSPLCASFIAHTDGRVDK